MLTIHIITVGRDKEPWVAAQVEHYARMLRKYARIEFTVVPEAKYGKGADIKKALAAEAEAVRSRLKGGYLVLLDVNGKPFSTESLANELKLLQAGGQSCIEFVIGGPFGLDPGFKRDKSKGGPRLLMSLSPFTLSHQITRLVLLEQLYRTLNLNAGGSYHK